MSLLVFTGASQFALVSALGSGGNPFAAAAGAFFLGTRNAFYGLRLSQLLGLPRAVRPLAAQWVIDETSAVALAQRGRAAARLGFTVTGATLYLLWNLTTLVGAMGGFFGGVIDDLLVRVTELFQTVPSFLLVIVIVAIGRPNVTVIALAIGSASWPTVARIVRAEFRRLRSSDFVLAARSQGFSDARIIFGEILPNALPPVIVTASVMVASAILIESSLSFLGMGDPNVVTWGGMIGAGRDSLRTAWYLTAVPGAAIVLAVLALNLLGDGLNDALNPRMRERS
jgi:peptide/nickel transport system permease protein